MQSLFIGLQNAKMQFRISAQEVKIWNAFWNVCCWNSRILSCLIIV